jgi:hypothetical protein
MAKDVELVLSPHNPLVRRCESKRAQFYKTATWDYQSLSVGHHPGDIAEARKQQPELPAPAWEGPMGFHGVGLGALGASAHQSRDSRHSDCERRERDGYCGRLVLK